MGFNSGFKGLNLYLASANKTRGRTAEVWWLYIHYVYCAKRKNSQTEFTYHLFSRIAWIKKTFYHL